MTQTTQEPQQQPPRPRVTSSEVALTGPEFMPVYANLIREQSTLPPPQQGGDQGWS